MKKFTCFFRMFTWESFPNRHIDKRISRWSGMKWRNRFFAFKEILSPKCFLMAFATLKLNANKIVQFSTNVCLPELFHLLWFHVMLIWFERKGTKFEMKMQLLTKWKQKIENIFGLGQLLRMRQLSNDILWFQGRQEMSKTTNGLEKSIFTSRNAWHQKVFGFYGLTNGGVGFFFGCFKVISLWWILTNLYVFKWTEFYNKSEVNLKAFIVKNHVLKSTHFTLKFHLNFM